MGPAAVALFAGYQPAENMKANAMMVNAGGKAAARSAAPAWAMGDMGVASAAFGSAEGMSMLSMAAPPPSLPFVSFPAVTKNNLPSMPWSGEMNFGLNNEQFVQEEAKPAVPVATDNFEAAELEELLDFSLPDDAETVAKDKAELVNLDDGFDGTEMSILYSFLVDAPEDKLAEKKSLEEEDDGILNLNILASTPIESLMDSLDGDFTEDDLLMPAGVRHPEAHLSKMKPAGEVKSRRLCKAEGCYKRSRSNGLCISHGGGRRCSVEGCDKSSQGGNLCIRHGGGKRCSHEGCDKAAQSNFLCKAHGGGPRCQFNGCMRSSQGGGFCRSHGGGKRCMFDGCDKGTQRGDYCALHGGSRLCEVPGCMRNDRGGGLCATHGGGKRCTVENCEKPCRRKGLCSAHLRQAEGTK